MWGAQAKTDRPGYPETHMLLAETLLKGGRLEEAEKVKEYIISSIYCEKV